MSNRGELPISTIFAGKGRSTGFTVHAATCARMLASVCAATARPTATAAHEPELAHGSTDKRGATRGSIGVDGVATLLPLVRMGSTRFAPWANSRSRSSS
jgi:hypothetical protein